MVKCTDLIAYCDHYLTADLFNDYCPNGLQVEGKEEIHTIVSGVTASQVLIDAAINKKADLLLVHHGFFWKGESSVITGIKKHRLHSLLMNDINLVAYHLPLDAHKIIGNNVLLAHKLGIEIKEYFSNNDIALLGEIETHTGKQFKQLITQILDREPVHIEVNRPIKRIALCTGAAQGYIDQAIQQGADAFISGEISESTWHIAKENNIHYFAAGHHATEKYGVQALGEHLASQFSLQHTFIDIYNPI